MPSLGEINHLAMKGENRIVFVFTCCEYYIKCFFRIQTDENHKEFP